MKLTRRTVIAGAAAIPAVLGLERVAAGDGTSGTIFVYDKSLPEAERGRAAAISAGQQARAIGGDTVRFAREVVSRHPTRISGLSRQADAVLIEDVAAEEGYVLVTQDVRGAQISWQLVRRA
ncbi:MAG: hypothetical protein WA957_00960 [Alteraurantiacibacter sp.]